MQRQWKLQNLRSPFEQKHDEWCYLDSYNGFVEKKFVESNKARPSEIFKLSFNTFNILLLKIYGLAHGAQFNLIYFLTENSMHNSDNFDGWCYEIRVA